MNTPHSSELNNTELPEFPDGIYYPSKQSPGVRLATCAFACIEAALEHALEHEEKDDLTALSIAAYQAVVQSWDLAGCRAVIGEMAGYKEDFTTWQCSLDEALNGDKPLPDWPHEWVYSLVKVKYNADFHELVKHAHSFVSRGFNRKLDIQNQTLKIVPEKSPLWLATIVYSLLVHYLPYSEVESPEVLAKESTIAFIRFQAALADTFSTRPERRAKQAMRQTLKREGYQLKHYSVIRKGAEMWYKCRVNPGTIEAYRDELAKEDKYQERSNIEIAIAPYDQATSYPRQWRK